MKKLSFIVIATLVLVMGLSGCLSTLSATSGSGSSSSARVTVNLYLNVPQDDLFAVAAEKLVVEQMDTTYNGRISFSYTGTPSAANLAQVGKFYGYCEGIRLAIEKGHNSKCNLTFNTEANGNGTPLDFSNSTNITRSILMMALYNYTTVYAIYEF